jgi:hypothetical protein
LKATKLTGVILTCLLLMGCLTFPPPPPEPVRQVDIHYKRIAIVEFYNRTPYAHPAEQFTEQLRDKLTEWTTSTDVIVVPKEDLPNLGDPFVGGSIPLDVIVDIRTEHLADAVIIGSVDEHNPYQNPSVHITLKVIDTGTAAFPYGLSEGWDAGDKEVREAIESYYRRNHGKDDCRFGPELFRTSPRYFLRFVADRIAQKLTAAL